MILGNTEISISGRWLKTAVLKNQWIDDIEDPEPIIKQLNGSNIKADFFSFSQRYPNTEPKYPYYLEWDNWAILKVTTYEDWFNHQINRHARKAIRKALRIGVDVRIVPLNDEFIEGVTTIFNETPFRQGRKFAHFGKTFQEVKDELSRESDRTDFIGTFFQGQMIGFIQLIFSTYYAVPFGGVSLITHRDKSPNNAMLAKAVEACASRGIKYMVYGYFDYGTGGGGLAEFKIHNGFEKALVPRYYVPLTIRGRIYLRLKLHQGIKGMIPKRLLKALVEMRKKWRVVKKIQE